jgi:hypothetical protein
VIDRAGVFHSRTSRHVRQHEPQQRGRQSRNSKKKA